MIDQQFDAARCKATMQRMASAIQAETLRGESADDAIGVALALADGLLATCVMLSNFDKARGIEIACDFINQTARNLSNIDLSEL
jgi:hypothetical protein